MATHFLRPARLLTFLQVLSLTFAKTTYECVSETNSMFHQDCAVAANQLVLSLIRDNGQAHVPDDNILHTYNRCKAGLQTSGAEKTVLGTDLLLSFAQIGARCQQGTFSYEGGMVEGSLEGQSSWKRGSLKERGVVKARYAPTRHSRRDLHLPTELQGHRMQKRDMEMMSARKGYDGETYRLMMISSHGVPGLYPSSPQVTSMFYQRSREFLSHHFSREDAADVVFGNAYPIAGGTHVSVVTLGIKLNGQKSWKQFVDGQTDQGTTVKDLIADGISMFTTQKFVAAYFSVLASSGKEVFSFMLYGFDSLDTPVPS